MVKDGCARGGGDRAVAAPQGSRDRSANGKCSGVNAPAVMQGRRSMDSKYVVKKIMLF